MKPTEMRQYRSPPLSTTGDDSSALAPVVRLVASPLWINRALWSLVALLLVGNVVSQLTDHRDYLGRAAVQGLFDVTLESSLPTWLSAVLFLGSAGLFLLIRQSIDEPSRVRSWSWVAVAALMVVLSIDEVASLHETVSPVVRSSLGVGGFLFYAWLIPALAFMAILGVVLLPWLVSLPRRLLEIVLLGGGLFLIGTVGLEMVGGHLVSSGMRDSTEWIVVASIEESLELVGVAVLFSGLLGYASTTLRQLRLDLGQK